VALILALLKLLVVFFILMISSAWGIGLLHRWDFESDNHLESLLFANGFSFAFLEIVLFVLALIGRLNFISAVTLLALMAITGSWRQFFIQVQSLFVSFSEAVRPAFDRVVVVLISLMLTFEALLSMAPLTGSDAMHYHFTAPLLEQNKPLAPIFWLMQSFYIGQAHLLVSLGLALHSDRIALGLLYLGGVLASAALFVISRELMPLRWAWIVVLSFASAPLVFWQTSTSGSPDMWMAFFVTISSLAASRAVKIDSSRWFILSGLFAGAAAGIKYTGWVIPFALMLYIVVAKRAFKVAVFSGVAALLAGVWPMARNYAWTGDPMFPFFTGLLTPARVNAYALGAFRAATGAAHVQRDLMHLLGYPFFLIFKGNDHGLGQFFGPLVLAFSPLLVFARWEKAVARIAATLWAVVYLSNLFSSQMGRLLLPVFGLSLALVFSGVAEIFNRRWKLAGAGCAATILVFLVFATASDAIYARGFLPVVLGAESEQAFLKRTAPDYQTVEFINRMLQPEMRGTEDGRVMVFFRHLYYIRVPFVDGSPEYSWLMNPTLYNDKDKLLAHLRELDVRWVIKAPDYPPALEPAFSNLETEGDLVPVASTDVENLTGTGRIYGQRQRVHVVLLSLGHQDSSSH
jgi:Dolichyl-phosphate-mannose-protein mannosyltransferase